MSTHFVRKEDTKHSWFLMDATDQVVGRVATSIAKILRGKHKVNFTRHVDNGDYVVVVNADKVNFTGNKWDEKKYYTHTGYVGGVRSRTAREMLKKNPTEILRLAVWGMMNKTHLARRQMMKLKIYTGTEHPHSSQKVQKLENRKDGKVIA